nr:hypothetical protein BaRGS_034789 [Batillaria attramentaria]
MELKLLDYPPNFLQHRLKGYLRPYHWGPDGNVICKDIQYDVWIEVLMAFIVITKILVVLYSPSFLPGSLYRLKYVATEYIYHIPETAPFKRIRMVVTQFPGTYGNDQKIVRLSEIKGMEYFKTMVDTNMHLDKLYDVTMDRVRLSVKSRRLLGENYVPVGLLKMIYNNLFRCRIRRLDPLKTCCETNILGKLNPGLKLMKWYQCCRVFAHLVFLIILILPWILRIIFFFVFEDEDVAEKRRVAGDLGLSVYFQGNFTLYLTPVHGLFVFIYLIFIVDSVVYNVISKAMKEKFKLVLRKCLRDMRERSRIAVCAWGTRMMVVPFQMFGVVGILLFLPYLIIILPLGIPVVAFYLFPAVNLSFRLIIHLFLFMCPAKVVDRWEEFSERFSKLREHLDLNQITAEETFERGRRLGRSDIALQIAVILMCLVSFWSVTFLLMEVVSFFVEMGVYTLMGIIVNAGSTLQYITVISLTALYGRAVFNEVNNTYLAYHKQIHDMLLAMKRDEIKMIARNEALDQENTALRVQGDLATPAEEPDLRLIVKAGVPQWRTSSMLMFLDRKDTPYTPEKFFYDSIVLSYCGAPGPLYLSFIAAFWSFGRILLFLFFVFIVVMAFGDAYSVSSTNQLLATVAGGFIPFLFRYVFSSGAGSVSLHTDSIQFKTQFHQAINRYVQSWPIFDIIPIEFGETNPRDSLVLNSTRVPNVQPSANNGSPTSHVPAAEGEERIDMALVDEMEGEREEEGGLDMIIDFTDNPNITKL